MRAHLTRRAALFCNSDLLAFSAIIEAREHGIAMPDPRGRMRVSPSITVEAAGIGQDAADLVRPAGESAQRFIEVPFQSPLNLR